MRYMRFTISYLALSFNYYALNAGFETGCVTGLCVFVTIFTTGFATGSTAIFEARVAACVVRERRPQPSTLVQGRGQRTETLVDLLTTLKGLPEENVQFFSRVE